MRIRTIKPEFWANERLAALPDKTRLLAVALLNYADDEGYFYANPEVMRGQLFPFEKSAASIISGVESLEKLDYLRLAAAKDGRIYGRVVSFCDHQRINRPTPSQIKDLAPFSEPSVSPHGALTVGMEGKGTGKGTGNRESASALVASLPFASPEFAAAWSDFCQHRHEIKKKLTPTATKQTFSVLAGWGESRAIAAIRFTIGKGWQGIREDDRAGSTLPAHLDRF